MTDQPPDPGRRQSSILEELERKVDKLLELPPRIELAISQRVPELAMFSRSFMPPDGRVMPLVNGQFWRHQVACWGNASMPLVGEFRTVDDRTVELTFIDACGTRGSTYRFVLFSRD